MKIIILAAGYATRLYPLTLSRPKPLLEVAGKPMIEYVLDNLAPIQGVDDVYVVANAKFAQQFEQWSEVYGLKQPEHKFKIVNDGSTCDDNKLGAIGDLHLVLSRFDIDDEIVVVAGDNLFSESLEAFGRFCRVKQSPVVGIYDVGDLAEIKKYNELRLDGQSRVAFFEEKPQRPTSTLTAIALYYYPRNGLPLIRQYIDEGNNPDQPGRLVQWLYQRVPFYTWKVPGLWFDIGSKEMLDQANSIFAKFTTGALDKKTGA